MKQSFRTHSSVWTFDDESMMFLRTPKAGRDHHPTVAYDTFAEPFVEAYNFEGRVWVQLSKEANDYHVSGALLKGESFTDIDEETAR